MKVLKKTHNFYFQFFSPCPRNLSISGFILHIPCPDLWRRCKHLSPSITGSRCCHFILTHILPRWGEIQKRDGGRVFWRLPETFISSAVFPSPFNETYSRVCPRGIREGGSTFPMTVAHLSRPPSPRSPGKDFPPCPPNKDPPLVNCDYT